MLIGKFLIKQEDDLYLVTYRDDVLAIEPTLAKAHTTSIQLQNVYAIGYKAGSNDTLEANRYHYM